MPPPITPGLPLTTLENETEVNAEGSAGLNLQPFSTDYQMIYIVSEGSEGKTGQTLRERRSSRHTSSSSNNNTPIYKKDRVLTAQKQAPTQK